jgi:hypothetical protein
VSSPEGEATGTQVEVRPGSVSDGSPGAEV